MLKLLDKIVWYRDGNWKILVKMFENNSGTHKIAMGKVIVKNFENGQWLPSRFNNLPDEIKRKYQEAIEWIDNYL